VRPRTSLREGHHGVEWAPASGNSVKQALARPCELASHLLDAHFRHGRHPHDGRPHERTSLEAPILESTLACIESGSVASLRAVWLARRPKWQGALSAQLPRGGVDWLRPPLSRRRSFPL